MHNAVCWLDLRLAQDKGLVFWQTITNAIIFCDSVLADCPVKVVRSNLLGRYGSRNFGFKTQNLNNEKLFAFDCRKIQAIIGPGEILCEKKELLSGWNQ